VLGCNVWQTGTGKTHTMMGTGEDIGIVPKMQANLFAEVGLLYCIGAVLTRGGSSLQSVVRWLPRMRADGLILCR
jgi:hypothetical protein